MEPVKFVAQFYSVRSTRDGGGRLTLEFGAESLDAIHAIQKLSGNVNLALAVVVYSDYVDDTELVVIPD